VLAVRLRLRRGRLLAGDALAVLPFLLELAELAVDPAADDARARRLVAAAAVFDPGYHRAELVRVIRQPAELAAVRGRHDLLLDQLVRRRRQVEERQHRAHRALGDPEARR